MGRLARSRRAWSGLAIVASTVLVALSFDRVVVEGSSMVPTFEPGDRLLLVRRLRPVRPGDLVAFDDPRDARRRLVKRVVAVQGELVDVVGDNPTSSTDSRDFGPVPTRSIRHLVARRYARGVGP
jgi:nickel-type superoxide dismutase maturation protease